jgi:hypothetical protein
LYTPRGKVKYEKLNYRITNLLVLTQDLLLQKFSGYLEIIAPHEKGLMFFHNGKVVNCFYEGTQDLQLTREQILLHFFKTQAAERETIVNAYELPSAVIAALSALDARPPAHRELETTFLDLNKLFETFSRKHFTGVLRFYRVRNNTRLGNLLVRSKKISSDQLKEAVRLQLSEEGALRLGDALVKIKAIAPEDLQWALNRQALTRKGSDIEIALALFFEGQFLGGYMPQNEILVLDPEIVITWVNAAEIFMDIIDGVLPSVVQLEAMPLPTESLPQEPEEEIPHPDDIILEVQTEHPGTTNLPGSAFATLEKVDLKPEAESRKGSREGKKDASFPRGAEVFESMGKILSRSRATDEEREEASGLSGDRLKISLNLPDFGSVAWEPKPEFKPEIKVELKPEIKVELKPEIKVEPKPEIKIEPKPEIKIEPKPESLPEQPLLSPEPNKETTETAAPVPELLVSEDALLPVALESGAPESAVRESSGYTLMQEILDHYMGFLGLALLERECRKVDAVGKTLTLAQQRRLCQNLRVPAAYLVGASRAEAIIQHIKERIGG